MVTAGVDVGAITAKAAILRDGESLASAIIMAGYDRAAAARRVLDQALAQAGLAREQVACLVATGYGRVQVPGADRSVTEITCHARGAHYLCPDVRTVIERRPDVVTFTYPAGHGFSCDERPSFDRASHELALGRSMAFLEENLGA